MPGLTMELNEVRGIAVITLSGRGETTDGPALQKIIDDALAMQSSTVVVDLSGVEFFGSYGVNALVRLEKGMESRGGAVRLAGPRPLIKDLLKRSRLSERFEIYPSAEEALG